MVRALERGLSLIDFESLTVGMILGFIFTFNNDGVEDDAKAASQSDMDNF